MIYYDQSYMLQLDEGSCQRYIFCPVTFKHGYAILKYRDACTKIKYYGEFLDLFLKQFYEYIATYLLCDWKIRQCFKYLDFIFSYKDYTTENDEHCYQLLVFNTETSEFENRDIFVRSNTSLDNNEIITKLLRKWGVVGKDSVASYSGDYFFDTKLSYKTLKVIADETNNIKRRMV